ncbi:MAG TPA: DUF1508 domain-containing protein [Gemmataceae bacterium]|nr:DUF1508 domain-containing protein [Gemmataceae bacterium]
MTRVKYALVALVAASALTIGGPVRGPAIAADEKGLTFELYKDAKEEFRWRLKAANGKVIAASSEGYKAKADCEHAIDLIKTGAATAKVTEVTKK